MKQRGIFNWIQQPKINRILHSFYVPRTPRQVERELNIQKLKMKPYLSKGLVKSLNPEGRKGRFYILTDKAIKLLKLPDYDNVNIRNYGLIGWVSASPQQRLVILKTMSVDSAKRPSEDIRKRCAQLNPCLTRISTKTILSELISKGLVDTEMNGKYRNYWLSEKGRLLVKEGINPLEQNII
jgi:hypothetical protein